MVRAAGASLAPATLVASHADEIPESVWADTADHLSVYAGQTWARLACDSGRYDCSYVQAVDRSSDRVLAILPVYVPRGRIGPHYGPEALLGPVSSRLGEGQRRWVYLGTHGGYLTELPFVRDLTERQRADVLSQLLAVADATRSAHDAAFCMAYAPRRDAQEFADAIGGPSTIAFTGGDCYLQVAFSSFEDYLATLGSHRRGIVVRDMKSFEGSGLRVEMARLIDVIEDVAPLVAQLDRKYGNPMTDDQALTFVRRNAAAFADESIVFVAREADEIVGCAVFYRHATRLYARFCGFDYARTDGSCVYPTLVFYAPLRYAIENGLDGLHLGTTSYPAKLLRGCSLRELWSVIGWQTLDEALMSEIEGESRERRRQFLDSWKRFERAPSLTGTAGGGGRAHS